MTTDERHKLYQEFQVAFPLETLKDMTLEQYTNLNRSDSFCYWIESRTKELGSYWGGSSYKFGIYKYSSLPKGNKHKRDEEYAWLSKYGNNRDEAFSKVKDIIIQIAKASSKGDWDTVEAIDFGSSYKWKIAFLYSKERLIPVYKRNMLVDIVKGLKISNANTLSIVDMQKIFISMRKGRDLFEYTDWLWSLQTKSDSSATAEHNELAADVNYWWLVASPKHWSFADLKVGDEVQYTVKNENGNKRRIPANFEQAKQGDIVIGYEANPIKRIVAIAKVARASDGEHISFLKTEQLLSPVSWFDFKDIPELQDMEFICNPNGSFFRMTKDEYEMILDLIRQENPDSDDNPLVSTAKHTPYTKDEFLGEVFMDSEAVEELISLLTQKQNVILQGAPGVGKTFSAKRLAYLMMGEKDDSRIDMIQFHQNYSYEDFIMGFKPTEKGGFELRNGIFYDFCKRAEARPDRSFFFIIDEINRGNLSKIFGELLMLIENDYRGTSVRLAYCKELFAVPKNLYIIGMMNTADRSLAMIDYALRRRFSFYSMRPGLDTDGFKSEIAKHEDERVAKVVEIVRDLNKRIAEDDSLGEGFCIGHSYFCGKSGSNWIENVVKYDLCPMLEEYWFDEREICNTEKKRLIDALK